MIHDRQRVPPVRGLLLPGLVVFLLACITACAPTLPQPGSPPVAPSGQTTLTAAEPLALLDQVALDPSAYLGQQVTVEGTLEAEGSMPDVRFFLRSAQDHRLQVSAWAPIEVARPPSGGTAPRTMASYVGRRLLLTGVVERQADQVLLQVARAEEP